MGTRWQNTHTAVTLHRHDPHAEPNRNDKKITKNETNLNRRSPQPNVKQLDPNTQNKINERRGFNAHEKHTKQNVIRFNPIYQQN